MIKDKSVNGRINKGKITKKSESQQLMTLPRNGTKMSFWSKIKSSIIKNPLRRVSRRNAHEVDEKLKLAFKHLHLEFTRREQQLEERIQEIQVEHETVLLQRKKRLWWIIPLGLTIAMAGGYMLFVLTNMQDSMSNMTGNIQSMNNHMGNMSGDTQNMSKDMQAMNGSMGEMNHKVGDMTDSIAPMGEAASTTVPFMKAARSFWPF